MGHTLTFKFYRSIILRNILLDSISKILMNHCERKSYIHLRSAVDKNKTLKTLGAVCIIIIEGDKLELTNLNGQNYIYTDIDKTKMKGIAWIEKY